MEIMRLERLRVLDLCFLLLKTWWTGSRVMDEYGCGRAVGGLAPPRCASWQTRRATPS